MPHSFSPAPGVTVVDDFLTTAAFRAISASAQFFSYASPHAKGWTKAYGLTAASVLQTDLVLRGARDATPEGLHPLGQFVDQLWSASFIRSHLEDLAAAGEDLVVSARVVLMGVGAGIGWHEDGTALRGAYVFYVHPRWGSTWGGDLMLLPSANRPGVASERAVEVVNGDIGPDFDLDNRDEARVADGIGHFVAPRPNRLVLIAPDVTHRVAPVAAAAGEAVRTAVTGFVLPLRDGS